MGTMSIPPKCRIQNQNVALKYVTSKSFWPYTVVGEQLTLYVTPLALSALA